MSNLKGRAPDRLYTGTAKLNWIRTLVVFKDLVKLSKELKTVKLTKENFLELCESAITSNSESVLQALLDAYYQFWTQDTFESIYSLIVKHEKYMMISFMDLYIDEVNSKHESYNSTGG